MLAEWHLSPDDILENWTEERLDLFWRKRNKRLRRLSVPCDVDGERTAAEQDPRYVSNREFFTGAIGRGLVTPNAKRFKRVQVMN